MGERGGPHHPPGNNPPGTSQSPREKRAVERNTPKRNTCDQRQQQELRHQHDVIVQQLIRRGTELRHLLRQISDEQHSLTLHREDDSKRSGNGEEQKNKEAQEVGDVTGHVVNPYPITFLSDDDVSQQQQQHQPPPHQLSRHYLRGLPSPTSRYRACIKPNSVTMATTTSSSQHHQHHHLRRVSLQPSLPATSHQSTSPISFSSSSSSSSPLLSPPAYQERSRFRGFFATGSSVAYARRSSVPPTESGPFKALARQREADKPSCVATAALNHESPAKLSYAKQVTVETSPTNPTTTASKGTTSKMLLRRSTSSLELPIKFVCSSAFSKGVEKIAALHTGKGTHSPTASRGMSSKTLLRRSTSSLELPIKSVSTCRVSDGVEVFATLHTGKTMQSAVASRGVPSRVLLSRSTSSLELKTKSAPNFAANSSVEEFASLHTGEGVPRTAASRGTPSSEASLRRSTSSLELKMKPVPNSSSSHGSGEFATLRTEKASNNKEPRRAGSNCSSVFPNPARSPRSLLLRRSKTSIELPVKSVKSSTDTSAHSPMT